MNVTSSDYLQKLDNTRGIRTNADLYIWHDIMPEGGYDLSEENRLSLKRIMMPEVATQFREGQMVPEVKFR